VINIAILTDSFIGATGGSEKHIKDLVNGLHSSEFTIDIIQLSKENFIPHESGTSEKNISFHHIPVNRVYGFSGIKALFSITKLVKQKKIQIILSFHEMSDILNALIPTKVAKLSSRRDMGFQRNKVLEKVIRYVNRYFDSILCPSKAVQQKVLSENVKKDKTFLLYNGINSDSFTTTLEQSADKKCALFNELKIQKKDINIVTIGNLNTWKGHKYLIDAIKIINSNGITSQLVIFGDGELRKILEQQIKDLKLEGNVHLKGYLPNARDYLSAFDLMALPSLTEGLSNALLEGAASGLPLIATNVGGNPEVVKNDINGILVLAEDANALAKGILQYLPNTEKHKQASKASREIIETDFSLKYMYAQYNSLFKKLTNKNNYD